MNMQIFKRVIHDGFQPPVHSPRSFAQFSMSQRSNGRARGEPGDEATVAQ